MLKMIELKPIEKMMKEYKDLLSKYGENIETLGTSEIKKIIFEVKLFWYRQKRYVDYFLTNIEKKDKVAFLAGAVRLDIKKNGHQEFCLVGKLRIVNDPITKMGIFYSVDEDVFNADYINQYFKDCLSDLLVLLQKYENDFIVLPLEEINETKNEEYHEVLMEAADQFVMSLLSDNYPTKESFLKENMSFEEIEKILLDSVSKRLIFNSFKDIGLSLRDKCNLYFEQNGDKMSFYRGMNETQQFYMLVSQFTMQVLAIVMLMKVFHMTPYIRDEVTYQYFEMLFSTNIMDDCDTEEYFDTYIPFVLQRFMDLEDEDYTDFKKKYGNGKLIDYIKINCRDNKSPSKIMEAVECYKKELG